MSELRPAPDWRYVLRRGMRGTDCAALQINLEGLAVDGVFGGRTEGAVKAVQRAGKIGEDGVAGLVTQRRIVLDLSEPSERGGGLPGGMLASICANESGFALAAFSRHPSDAGFDLGAYQRSIPPPSIGDQRAYLTAYDVAFQADRVAADLAARYERYRTARFVRTPSPYGKQMAAGAYRQGRHAWQLAVLEHNWPVAAAGIADRGSIFVDPARDDQEAAWVVSASGGRLRTPRQWAVSYVERATALVAWPA